MFRLRLKTQEGMKKMKYKSHDKMYTDLALPTAE